MDSASDREPRYRQLLDTIHEMMPGRDTTLVELYLLFLQVAGEGAADRQAFFDRFALSEGKFVVLGLLKSSGSLTPSQLAEAIRVTPGTITGLLAGLERAGLVSRQEHPTDGRKATIVLAPPAFALLEQILTERFVHMESLLSPFTHEEQLQLHTLLTKLHQRFTADSSA